MSNADRDELHRMLDLFLDDDPKKSVPNVDLAIRTLDWIINKALSLRFRVYEYEDSPIQYKLINHLLGHLPNYMPVPHFYEFRHNDPALAEAMRSAIMENFEISATQVAKLVNLMAKDDTQ